MKLTRAEEAIARQNLEDDVVDLAGTCLLYDFAPARLS